MLLVAMPGAPSSDALAPSSVLVPSNARSYVRSVLATFVAMPFVTFVARGIRGIRGPCYGRCYGRGSPRLAVCLCHGVSSRLDW